MSMRLTLTLALLLTAPAARAQTPAPPAGTIEYYHVDALGSVRAVTDASGAVVRTYHYHPFGEGVGVEAGTDPMRFTGKPRDGETALDYFGARYYAPRMGRFTTVDPVTNIDAALTIPQRWNRFAYAGNNPNRFVDPDGRDFFDRVTGAANAIASNFGFAPRLTGGNDDFKAGQKVGDLTSIVIGAAETIAGGAIATGGTASTATVIGAPVGVPVAVAGGAVMVHGAVGSLSGIVHMASERQGGGGQPFNSGPPTEGATRLKGGQGWRDRDGNIWKKDQLHKDHWDVTDRRGQKVKEVDFNGRQIWPDGPKNKNK